MSALLLAAGQAATADTEALAVQPEFRKATGPMLLATFAVEQALAALPASARATIADWGLVVGVSHGELEVTKDFLCTLASRGSARPFLFQNALHNATLGFLSLRYGIQGPGLTTSTHHFAGEDALALGVDLLAAGDCAACLVIGVEAIDASMLPAVQAIYGAAATPGSGAGAVVLGTSEFADSHGLAGSGGLILASVTCKRSAVTGASGPALGDYHGAVAVTALAAAVLAGRPGVVELQKPDGASSRMVLAALSRHAAPRPAGQPRQGGLRRLTAPGKPRP